MSLLNNNKTSAEVTIPSTETTLLMACLIMGTREVTWWSCKEVEALRARRTNCEVARSMLAETREGLGTAVGTLAKISLVLFSAAFATEDAARLVFLTNSAPVTPSSSLNTSVTHENKQ
jgi:hypothetical protein